MDWVDPIINEPIKEREDDMSSLTARFVMRMPKWATSAQGETIFGSEVPGGMSHPDSRPDLIGGSKPSPGCETIY